MTGLFRVRKFHQDDAHIFCTMDQMHKEIQQTLEFVKMVYDKLGFKSVDYALSTRPQANYIGELKDWDAAEYALIEALNSTGKKWYIKEGDGAFYGPKIDIMVKDALGRKHQTATIQLDFQLPLRFDLEYTNSDSTKSRPVIIHRAILGSLERMMGILIEHYGGKWPFWLSPRQILVVTTRQDEGIQNYAKEIKRMLSEFYCGLDVSDRSLPKKIFEANKLGYNSVIVIGDQEVLEKSVSIRGSGSTMLTIPIAGLIKYYEQINK